MKTQKQCYSGESQDLGSVFTWWASPKMWFSRIQISMVHTWLQVERERERLVTGSLLVGSAFRKHGEEGWNHKISFCFFSFFFSSPPTNEPWETLGLQARAWHWLSKFSTAAAFNLSLPPFYPDYFKISIESNVLLSHFHKCAVLLWTPPPLSAMSSLSPCSSQ